MTPEVKICGVRTAEDVMAAAGAGAAYVGFVFFPKSPRALRPDMAERLVRALPCSTTAVALLVDPDDALIERVLKVRPGMIQLHGCESPARVAEIRTRTGLPVMKAIGIARTVDFDVARRYEHVADRLLFDAKAPKTPSSLPGGNGVPFDWRLLAGTRRRLPWMLSGGLTPDNVARAMHLSGARAVDVSSGVEAAPGVKDPVLIHAFMKAANSAMAREQRGNY